MKGLWLLCLACGVLGLGGCGGVAVDRYRGEQPVLDLARYFEGTVDGWGIFQDRSGQVVKRFHVVIDASWATRDGVAVGTLDEHFSWSDGSTSRRVWTITRSADGRYVGRADDVVGDAEGKVAGNALHWRYVLALPVDGRVWHVDFDDWMFLVDDQVMLNRARMSKFGFDLGEVTLSLRKR
ncbi:MAG: DUF3833 domain-containing protein [Candidatus Accumulibacter similis]|nr:MAG: DUF3833 domain-containing protein [Candidatus Accumulibacter similis]